MPFLPHVMSAQLAVKSQSLLSLRVVMISRALKFSSSARGAFAGSRACRKADSTGVSHLVLPGTNQNVSRAPGFELWQLTVREVEVHND